VRHRDAVTHIQNPTYDWNKEPKRANRYFASRNGRLDRETECSSETKRRREVDFLLSAHGFG
jgi:hypothetical protein